MPAVLSHGKAPVFVLGMTRRTGTNFLQDLLCLHPDCRPCPIQEDYLATYSNMLVKYADNVAEHWDPKWGIDRAVERERLCRCIGCGLVNFLNSPRAEGQFAESSALPGQSAVRIVAKTPSVCSLESFFKIFPQAQALIVVRDGRAVVESAVRTFKKRSDRWARQWADAARTVLRFRQSSDHNPFRYLIVKYEDLWMHREQELPRILSFLDLDVSRYDFDAASKLPIRGSSTLAERGTSVHWTPVERTTTFDPLQRWAHWSRAQHERFNWIAGEYLECFGYQKASYRGGGWLWTLWNETLDIVEVTRQVARGAVHLARKVWGHFARYLSHSHHPPASLVGTGHRSRR